jgi:hypothetical protein
VTEEHEGYDGPARLSAGECDDAHCVDVEVVLRGVFEPIDGRYHWWGRVGRSERLEELVRSGGSVVLTTPEGAAEGRLSDIDPWGRYRVSGTGRPPFAAGPE